MSGRARISSREASADLLLDEVVFERDGGESVTLGRLEWTDVRVGWHPG